MKKINLSFFKRLPAREKKITIPTILTLTRIVLAPVIVVLMVYGWWGLAFACIVYTAITDIIDGNLARLLNEKTLLGACLDPIADKALILSIFYTLAFVQTPLFILPFWFVFLVLLKEMLQFGGAIVFYLVCGYLYVSPNVLGKLTTVVQISFILWLFACYFFRWMPVKTYYTMLGIVIILVFASLAQYTRVVLQLFWAQKKG
jgi:cardiolipin synthase